MSNSSICQKSLCQARDGGVRCHKPAHGNSHLCHDHLSELKQHNDYDMWTKFCQLVHVEASDLMDVLVVASQQSLDTVNFLIQKISYSYGKTYASIKDLLVCDDPDLNDIFMDIAGYIYTGYDWGDDAPCSATPLRYGVLLSEDVRQKMIIVSGKYLTQTVSVLNDDLDNTMAIAAAE